ncbi:MAG: putative Regulator of nonsense transcripts 1, partial [Streblomastix strix]
MYNEIDEFDNKKDEKKDDKQEENNDDDEQEEKKDDLNEEMNNELDENEQDNDEIQQIDMIRDYYQEKTGLNMVQIVDDLSAPNLAKLNASQSKAVHIALTRPLSLIQGPPGTGKTVVSATIVYHWVKMRQGQILVCAPSNVAVDHLTEKIAAFGAKVVRLEARTREINKSSIENLTLGYQVKIADSIDAVELHRLQKQSEYEGARDRELMEQIRQRLDVVERSILSQCDVITCTNAAAGDYRLFEMQFPYVLIDESTQSLEPESLISLVKGARHTVLVGDQNQLGPNFQTKEAAIAGLQQSLFERLILLKIEPVMLQTQYRMHPEIASFSSQQFYDGKIESGVTAEERTYRLEASQRNENQNQLNEQRELVFPWPNPDCPMMFLHSTENDKRGGTSFSNENEAKNVLKIVQHLLLKGVAPNQIGVITPYRLQIAYILNCFYKVADSSVLGKVNLFSKEQFRNIQVASVDAFQGREKDFIIFSCVRSNDRDEIGFLRDPRRLNVALTRAKYGLIILGNAEVLSNFHLWNNLLVHLKERNCLVQGSLNRMRPAQITLKQSVKLDPIQSVYLPFPSSLDVFIVLLLELLACLEVHIFEQDR